VASERAPVTRAPLQATPELPPETPELLPVCAALEVVLEPPVEPLPLETLPEPLEREVEPDPEPPTTDVAWWHESQLPPGPPPRPGPLEVVWRHAVADNKAATLNDLPTPTMGFSFSSRARMRQLRKPVSPAA